ncbi:MAG: prolyl oligopeptidase family serine peptidase [Gemmatimonadota bacterium]|nr:prolyl oligopeptidase family serine peptidase [Gemmatimonadota bacterium]MDE2866459.1 prolyl oligopeptidase family serine peptidase [Gemmatimonadota bacterium]
MTARNLIAAFLALAAFDTVALPSSASPQTPPLVTPDDYGRWEDVRGLEVSPFGDWIAYVVERVDENSELRVRKLDEDSTRVFPWGSAPTFSPDGRWLAWTVDLPPDERERLEAEDQPVRDKATVMDLGNGNTREFDAVAQRAFDATGRFLALRGYAPDEPAGKGADVRVVELDTGAQTVFGNVGEMAWSPVASLLALAIATGTDLGNGVQIHDAATGTLRSADASGSAYRSLAWRDDSSDLAALRSRQDASADGTAYDVLAWRDLDRRVETTTLDANAAGIPDSLEVVRHRAPAWSDDGTMISIGLRPVEAEEDEDEDEEGDDPGAGAASDADAAESDDGAEEEPDLPTLQIWHTSDVRLFPEQKVAEGRDAARTLLAVWHLDEGRVVPLGTDLMASTRLLHGWETALEETDEPYPWGAMFGRPYRDVWAIDTKSGEREKVLTRVRYAWPSEGGDWMLRWDGAAYHTLDLHTGAEHDVTSGLDAEFANTEYDTPTDVTPPHGFGAPRWLRGDDAVLLYDKHDIWRVAPDGSGGSRLTRGAEAGVTHRIVSLGDDGDEPGLDRDSRPYLTLYNEKTEQRGYARFADGWELAETLILEDAFVGGLVRADSADVLLYGAERFDDPPDYFVAGPDLAQPVQVTGINPFIDEVAWGRAELVDFVSESGRDLQFVLLRPANHEEGRAVPTIVYTYEMLSPQMHFFRVPSERDYYNYTAWTQHGYAVLLPDIVYRARDPGVSALESVRAAVAKAVEMGVTNPDAVGLIGHSWGGYQATFLPTRTDIFAASVAGAPLTDFVSFMGQLHWNPGIAEVSHWETGQARMEVPFWADPEAHRRNSPIHEVHNMETPLLMAFGDDDGVVDWDQGTEFFNFARRAEKQMVLLVYEGEDHGFRREANQRDYHRRILEWFGHYLKGEPAPAWITDGVRLGALEDEKKRVAGGANR